jgi:hypothetical protein
MSAVLPKRRGQKNQTQTRDGYTVHECRIGMHRQTAGYPQLYRDHEAIGPDGRAGTSAGRQRALDSDLSHMV